MSPAKSNPGFSYFLWLVAARIVGMGSVAAALPVSHVLFGEQYPGLDGHSEFGFIIVLMIIGFVAAFIYLAVASTAHFIVRKKSLRVRCWVEVGVFALFIIVLAVGGITAHYS